MPQLLACLGAGWGQQGLGAGLAQSSTCTSCSHTSRWQSLLVRKRVYSMLTHATSLVAPQCSMAVLQRCLAKFVGFVLGHGGRCTYAGNENGQE
jgi:hypothetical protein